MCRGAANAIHWRKLELIVDNYAKSSDLLARDDEKTQWGVAAVFGS